MPIDGAPDAMPNPLATVTNQCGMPTPSTGGRLTATSAGGAASIESASDTAGVGRICVAGDVAASTALATGTAGTGGAGQSGPSLSRTHLLARATRLISAGNHVVGFTRCGQSVTNP